MDFLRPKVGAADGVKGRPQLIERWRIERARERSSETKPAKNSEVAANAVRRVPGVIGVVVGPSTQSKREAIDWIAKKRCIVRNVMPSGIERICLRRRGPDRT